MGPSLHAHRAGFPLPVAKRPASKCEKQPVSKSENGTRHCTGCIVHNIMHLPADYGVPSGAAGANCRFSSMAQVVFSVHNIITHHSVSNRFSRQRHTGHITQHRVTSQVQFSTCEAITFSIIRLPIDVRCNCYAISFL